MAITCPNKSLKAWKDLVEVQGEDISYALWNAYDGMVPDKYYLQATQPTVQIKKGVSELFESNPELANIGTPEQYSQYLDTIFPDSKVKDIVYHGANEPIEGERFIKRAGATGRGIWFSGSRKYAQIQMDRAQPSESLIGRKLRGAPTMYQVVLNIKNPKHFYDATGALLVQTPREFEKQYDRTVDDAALFHHPNSKKPATADSADQVVVFEPEQIHILGNKQDIEGFKEFVKNNSTELQLQQIEQELEKEQVAEQRILKYEDSNTKALMERFGISYLPPRTIPKKADTHNKAKEANAKLRAEGSAYEAIVTKQRATYAGKLKEIWVVRFVRSNSKNIVTSDRYGSISSTEALNYVENVTNGETVESVSELIDNVLASEELTDDVRELLELIKSLGLDLPITFINSIEDTALMFTDGISITINTAHKVHPKIWAEALVHELIHVTAENALQTNEQFARRVNALYRKYFNRKGTSTSYGFTNESEFIAELMSNPAFRQELESIDSMWTKFLKFVSELFGIKGSSELNRLTLQIKDIIAENSNKVQPFERKDIKYSTDPKESMEKILKSVSDRIKTFQQKNKSKDLIATQEELLGKVKKEYDSAKYLQGMLTYVDNVDKFVTEDDLFKRIDDLLDTAENGDFDKIFKTGGSVRDLGTFIYSYMNMMDDILQSLAKYTPTSEDEKLVITSIKEKIGKINTLLTEYKTHYADLSHIILSRFLEPFGMGESADQIKQALINPVKDISAATRWLMSLQESGDMILGLLDVAFKSFYSDARRESLEITKDLLIEKKKLEASGIKDTAWVYQKDDKGIPTGDYIIETQTALFLNERDLRFKELEQKFKDAEDAGTPFAENVKEAMIKKTYKALSKKYNIVSDTYWETAVAFEEFMQEKREELGARFDTWKKMNTYRRSDGELIVSLNTNPAYKEITSNKIKEDFYWKLTDTQVQLQKQFPPKFRNYRIIPQIRMDVIERVKTGDVNRMKDAFTELYQIKEDDANYGVDFGIKDERGKIVNFIPIYFTKKLSNMKDLSTDAVSSMIVFADMATRRNKLSQIVDILELGKEVIRDRGVFQTSNRGKILKNISNILGIQYEQDLTKDVPGNIYNRLEDFMDMMLYGKMKHDGKYEKAIDTFVYYTSVNNLALNLFAGIANANMGKIQNLIEATSKQFFGTDALAYAKKAYIAGLPGVMGDMGSRMDKSRLGLWIEQHNILDDFEQKVWGVNADRTTKGEQLADLGSLFFLSTAVEHNLHTEPALALAFNYRYDSKKERFVFKEEFFEELNNLKEAQRIEIQNLKGDNLTDKTKAIINKNKAKIESLEEKLNSEWKAIEKDNYYEAFERYEAAPGSFKMRLNSKYKNNATDAKKFENRVHSINHALAGIYNKLDRSAGQKYAIVRAAFNFRKWMIPAFNRRFKAYYKNYELQSELEGYYRTTGRFLQQLYKDIREGNVSIMKNWYSLKDFEKANLRRSASELAIFFLALAVMQALSHIEGDDDEDWALNMAAYQSRRLVTELGAMTPILPFTVKEGLKLLDSPLPMANQFTELSRLIEFWNWFDTLESGKYEGMYKIQRQLIRSIPTVKTVHDTFHPEEKIKFFNR